VNFLVDGIVDLDTGSNGTTHFNPNMDSVAEVRVLTSNFQAEYGRMASGAISVITKGGSQSFHGSGWWTWRHEQFNAKNFFDNYNNQPKSIYRYHVRGFSVGGPDLPSQKVEHGKEQAILLLLAGVHQAEAGHADRLLQHADPLWNARATSRRAWTRTAS